MTSTNRAVIWVAAAAAAAVVVAVAWVVIAFVSRPRTAPPTADQDRPPLVLSPAAAGEAGGEAMRLFDEAAALRHPTVHSPANSPLDYPAYPPMPVAWHELADASEAANRPVLAAARAARFAGAYDWGTIATPADAERHLARLNEARALANVVADAALHAHLRDGNDAEAVERVRDLRALAAGVADAPTLLNGLVSTGIDAMATYRLLTIAPAMKLAPAGASATAPAAGGAVDARLVRTLIGELLDAEPWLTRERRARQFEREQDASRRLAGPGGSLDDAQLIDRVYQRVEAERRMAAVSLALRLYRADHGGAMPTALTDLVPVYLPAVPTEPTVDGQPLGYRRVAGGLPGGGDRYLVLHRGDERGVPRRGFADDRIPTEPTYGWDASSGVQYRDVLRWSPPPAATVPVSDPQ